MACVVDQAEDEFWWSQNMSRYTQGEFAEWLSGV